MGWTKEQKERRPERHIPKRLPNPVDSIVDFRLAILKSTIIVSVKFVYFS